MKDLPDKYSSLFLLMSEAVQSFIEEVGKHNLTEMATERWSVKDELCHIVFWHDYYAKNYAAMAAGEKPFVFVSKGGSTRNQEGVDKLRHEPLKHLLGMLNNAQSSLYKSIVVKQVPEMTYIAGTEYKTEKFLEIVTGHIRRHTVLVKHAKKI